jgi:hypothetical protein
VANREEERELILQRPVQPKEGRHPVTHAWLTCLIHNINNNVSNEAMGAIAEPKH